MTLYESKRENIATLAYALCTVLPIYFVKDGESYYMLEDDFPVHIGDTEDAVDGYILGFYNAMFWTSTIEAEKLREFHQSLQELEK